jgi:flagellin-like hook-associated protein FlgL
MATETYNLKAAQVVLSGLDRGELSRVQEGIRDIMAGTAILQIAENSLLLVSANLSQMKLLAAKILSDRFDDDIKDLLASEFKELAEQTRRIADTTTCNDHQLHRNDQTIEIYAEGQTTMVWMTQSVPAVETDLLARPEEVYRSVQNAIDSVNAYRSGIRGLLAALKQHTEALYQTSETILKTNAAVSSISAAATAAYRVSAQLLHADHAATACHSSRINAIAGRLIG